jgi:16S rRNA (uracil1498-N3)-methyltransferase
MNVVLLEAAEQDAPLGGERAAHVTGVLGLGVGGRFRVGVIDGPLGTAEIVAIEADGSLRLTLTWEQTPPIPRIDLVLALPRPKVLARLLSPIAQLGVGRLMLTGAWKVERFYFDAHILSEAEHRPKLIEGLAQAKDTRLPVVTVHRSIAFLLDQELDALVPDATRVVVDPSATRPLEDCLGRASGRVLLAIGPEGGFTARELAHLGDRGFALGSLGSRVLRSDVATVAALARAHARLAAHTG